MTPAKILVVEDDRVVARDIAQQLVRIGHTVVGTTARGEDALALTLATKPDLVLMDIRLEGSADGVDAATQLRASSRVPVIFLTAYADDTTVQRASRAEPFGYLMKPFEDSQLRTAIEMALYKHAAEQRVRDSERRYAVTLGSIGDAVIATNSAGEVAFMNAVAEALTGTARAESIGAPLDQVFRTARDTGPTVLRSRDGRDIAIDDSSAPIIDDDGTTSGSVIVFRDLTQRRAAEEAELLRQSNARLGLALRGSDIGIWEFELPDGAIETARARTVNFWEPLGYSEPFDVPFATIRDRWHPDDRERVVQTMSAYLAGTIPQYEVECRIRRSDGEYRTRLARGVVTRDGSGKAVRFSGSSVDITDRIRLEGALRASEERYRNTFENAPAGLIHTDFENYAVLRVNQTYVDMTGWSREELLGRRGMEIIHVDDRAAGLERFAALASGALSSYSAQFRIWRKDGALIWVRLTASISRDSPVGRSYVIAVVEDVSERKQLELELQTAKEAAEASNRAKGEFLANVSHEIRTPMNAILGMTELVLDTTLAEPQRQSLKTVKAAATSLLAIINDLLDFSKIEAGKMELDAVDLQLRALLGDTMRALAVRAHRKGLELLCSVAPDVPDALVGDAGRLRQILINLVGNAIKFTPRGEVQVDVTCAARKGDDVELRFAVRDTGIGIPGDKQASIFRAFEQEDMSTTRRYGGTGLGLTIAARFVEMMGGKIMVTSAPQQGSTFTFHARFSVRTQTTTSSGEAQPTLGALRVLVVDDNAANRDILEQWLAGWRMQPTTARDGMTAMDALWHGVSSRRPYALVLLDARMPDTDGLTLAAKIRERAELSATRIILLTSGDRPGDIERFRELRIDAHILKPVPQDELFETIRDVMTRTTDAGASYPMVASVRTAAETPAPGTLPLRVLVAEDNSFNSQLLQQLLASRGHAVRIAHDGREALDYARSGGFDLMLLDLHMPELDGFQVIAALREHEAARGGHLRTIALTARSRLEDRAKCFAAGMDDFLAKPVHAAALWASIERTAGPALAGRAQSDLRLITAEVLLAACDGKAAVLDGIREGLRARLPRDLAALQRALEAEDLPHVRAGAHSMGGMLAAFSTVAGSLASSLEDAAARGDLREAAEVFARLRPLAGELLVAADTVTIASLYAQLSATDG